ncbi:hypothetical protein ABW19_dt0209923 [Dactylella cylindrospora]|nr:hypothetical protein ABW19_dt0209923 [Dactylella cylindrospora]
MHSPNLLFWQLALLALTSPTHSYPTSPGRVARQATVSSDCLQTTQVVLPWNNANDTTACSISYHVPWAVSNPGWVEPPKIHIQLEGVTVLATVDTGSTGIVVSQSLFPVNAFNVTNAPQAHIFYSSSHWLEEGYTVTMQASLDGIIMHPQVLLKESEVCCPGFNTTTDGNRCPTAKRANPCRCEKTCMSEMDLSRIEKTPEYLSELRSRSQAGATAYMGIGFGRGVTPMANPFVQIVTINGTDLPSLGTSFCRGYVITNDGISIGITNSSLNDFKFLQLEEDDVAGERDWATPSMKYKADTGSVQNGTILVDTGIPNAYLSSSPMWNENSNVSVSGPGLDNEITLDTK